MAKYGGTRLPSFWERNGHIRLWPLRAIPRIVYASAPTKRLVETNLHASLNQAPDRTYPLHSKGNLMNKDQVKGNVKNFVGKVQAEVGKLFGSAEWEVKGIKLEVEGMAQKELGDEKWSRKIDRLAWWELWA